MTKELFITESLLPDIQKIDSRLRSIWSSKQLTNVGIQHSTLEKELCKYLNVPNVSLFTNGTIALMLAIKALRLQGEVITTPFTFPATIHTLMWNNITPVFCDIEKDTFNIDINNIESLITDKTSGILPVHLFGQPCNYKEIERLANDYGLKVIYDAAHAFGVEVDGIPSGNLGDISMFSFHATKIFHTVEGGCLTYKNDEIRRRLEVLRNFGIMEDDKIVLPGINGKMSEIHASIGLEILPLVEKEIEARKNLYNKYCNLLKNIPGIILPKIYENVKYNYQYFNIRIISRDFGITRNTVSNVLKKNNINTKKYFYPSCNKYSCYRQLPSSVNLPNTEEISNEVLVLPLHGRLMEEDVERICSIISKLYRGIHSNDY